MTLIIDIHALQTVPPSLINRDDTGLQRPQYLAVFPGSASRRKHGNAQSAIFLRMHPVRNQ